MKTIPKDNGGIEQINGCDGETATFLTSQKRPDTVAQFILVKINPIESQEIQTFVSVLQANLNWATVSDPF